MRTLSVARYFVILVATVFIMSVPFVQGAEGTTGGGATTKEGTTGGSGGATKEGTTGGSGARPGDTVGIINPLEAKTITEFLVAIVDVLLIFALPLIVIYIMYAGFMFVTAQGNPSEIESARTALLWAVVGGVIVLGAKLIIEVIEGTIKQFSP